MLRETGQLPEIMKYGYVGMKVQCSGPHLSIAWVAVLGAIRSAVPGPGIELGAEACKAYAQLSETSPSAHSSLSLI